MRLVLTILVSLWPLAGSASGQVQEAALARKVLGQVQVISAMENAEYCGFIGYDGNGRLVATEPAVGTASWCDPDWPEDLDVVASYHTHSAYDPMTWSEIPSAEDIDSDAAEGIDGYLSTPGGRFWFIDTSEMTARQICGIGCLPRAPNFVPAPEDDIRESYTYEALVMKIAGY